MQWNALDDTVAAYIRLRKAKDEGGQIGFEPGWACEVLDAVNSLFWRKTIRFGNVRYHEWKYISMETLLPGGEPKRKYARLEVRFDGDSPVYKVYIFDLSGDIRAEYTFDRISYTVRGEEYGLLPALEAACGPGLLNLIIEKEK